MEIHNPKEWRVSRSGFSIRTGWGDEKKMIATYPGKVSPLDTRQYAEWLDNANDICRRHNRAIAELQEQNDDHPRKGYSGPMGQSL